MIAAVNYTAVALGVVAVGNLMVLAEGPRFAMVAHATETEIIAAAGEAVAVVKLEVVDVQANAHSIGDPVDFRMKTDLPGASARHRSHLRMVDEVATREVPVMDQFVTIDELQKKPVESLDHLVS